MEAFCPPPGPSVPPSAAMPKAAEGMRFWGCRGRFAQTQRRVLAGPFREGRLAFPVNALVRKGKAEPGRAGHGPSSAHTQPPRAHGNAGCTRLGGACMGSLGGTGRLREPNPTVVGWLRGCQPPLLLGEARSCTGVLGWLRAMLHWVLLGEPRGDAQPPGSGVLGAAVHGALPPCKSRIVLTWQEHESCWGWDLAGSAVCLPGQGSAGSASAGPCVHCLPRGQPRPLPTASRATGVPQIPPARLRPPRLRVLNLFPSPVAG